MYGLLFQAAFLLLTPETWRTIKNETYLLGIISACVLQFDALAQYGQVDGVTLTCTEGASTYTLDWSGSWTTPNAGAWQTNYDVVGCYKSVYYYQGSSPATYYSPAPTTNPSSVPGSSDGTEQVLISKINANGNALFCVYVWFEYGYWVEYKVNGQFVCWLWDKHGLICNAVPKYRTTETCFARGTEVLTPNGLMPIEKMKVGDRILSTSRKNPSSLASVHQIKTVQVGHQSTVEVIIGGNKVRATHNHPVFTQNKGWVPFAVLEVGDRVQQNDGGCATVVAASTSVEYHEVFNLLIDGNSTYFVGSSVPGTSFCVADGCVSSGCSTVSESPSVFASAIPRSSRMFDGLGMILLEDNAIGQKQFEDRHRFYSRDRAEFKLFDYRLAEDNWKGIKK